MPSPREARAELVRLTDASTAEAADLLSRTPGGFEERRALLLDGIPGLIDYWAEGSAALASDFYDEQRELADVARPFTSELVLADRTVKIRRAIVWAAEPLQLLDEAMAADRLAEVVQIETARPFRDTITQNTAADPQAVGWKRITNQCCSFCRMLADRGAVYKESTARFAAHRHCDCSAAPVFVGGEVGPEASVIQYQASRRGRTEAQKAKLRDYLAEFYS